MEPPQLGLTALRLPSSLQELGATPLFAAAAAAPGLASDSLGPWLQQARGQPCITALDWPTVYRAITGGELQGQDLVQLVSLLVWAAEGARHELEAGSGGGEAAGAAAATSGDPRRRQALQNALKLSLFFLCELCKGSSAQIAATAQQQQAAGAGQPRRGKLAAAPAAAAALAQLRARRDALLAAGATEQALQECRALLPAVADQRAAGRLVRSAALHCLARPLLGAAAGDRAAKDMAEACFQAAAGILARSFVAAAGDEQAGAASTVTAAQIAHELLGVVCEPKQHTQVLASTARLWAGISQQSSPAGVALVSCLADRVQQLAAAASSSCRGRQPSAANTLAAQQLDACLQFAAQVAAAPPLQAAALLCLAPLLPQLLRAGGSTTRRLLLEVCSSLLPVTAQLPAGEPCSAAAPPEDPGASGAVPAAAAASPGEAYRGLLLAVVASRLADKDASLRAKALSVLEKHARLVAASLDAAAACDSAAPGGLVAGLCSRLCDKSPSVRKRAVALLAALLQPAAGLTRLATAALALEALPVAAKLLGALSQAALQLAASARPAAGVLHLLQLAASATDAAARQQLQAAALDLLVPPGASGPGAADALLASLTEVLQASSKVQLGQLREAVQLGSVAAGGTREQAAASAVCGAVQRCYERLHLLSSAAAADAAHNDSNAGQSLGAILAALFVLGPLSRPCQPSTGLAEAGLLLAMLQSLGAGSDGACVRLLACLTLAWRQLGAACFPAAEGSGSQQQALDGVDAAATAALAHATQPALQAVLLAPGCSSAECQAALDAAFALPPQAEAPLRLLQSLSLAATTGDLAAAAQALAPGAARLQMDAEGELQMVAAPTCGAAAAVAAADAGAACSQAGSGEQLRRQQVQHSALVAALDVLAGLAGALEEQKANFVSQLAARAHHERHQPEQRSKAGCPLRPAAQWWVGPAGGQTHGGSPEPPPGASSPHAGGTPPGGGDYMQAETAAAEHEAAAQRFLETLLQAADTAPASHLPLLERLAGGGGDEGAPVPPAVQASALRALGRLALLSEPVSCRAVQLAEAALKGGRSSGGGGTEVQEAAVAVLAGAINAHPNLHSGHLLLIGQAMLAPAEAGQEQPPAQPADSAAPAAAAAGAEPALQHAEAPRQQLPLAAAAAYCRLLLHNKLKLQGMLGCLGAALVASPGPVAAIVSRALRQLLGGAAPKERARLAMALFHQAPADCRRHLAQVLVDPGAGLLSAADLRGDVLASAALQALLAAAGAGAAREPAAAQEADAAAACLLRAMQPSAKVLAALSTQLQAGSSGGALASKLSAAARQALRAFVGNHVPAAAGAQEDAPEEGGAAAAAKRKRAGGGSKASSAALQQQLLALLSSGGGRGAQRPAGRPPRPLAAGAASSRPAASTAAAATGCATATTAGRGSCADTSTSTNPPSAVQ